MAFLLMVVAGFIPGKIPDGSADKGPAPGPQPPPCTIFMKTVEFLMTVNAVRVSSTGSGGVGREVDLFPKSASQPLSWAQGISHGHSRG